jgi:hypothetical protein
MVAVTSRGHVIMVPAVALSGHLETKPLTRLS